MHIDNKYSHGEIVYLITDPDQFERMITRLIISMNQSILYELTCGTQTSVHYQQEITGQKNMQLALGINANNHG